MRVFLDISADKIGFYGTGIPLFLERNEVDILLGKMLVEQDRKLNFSECLVLNGPGGFTNLRVGTLALNLLKTLKKGQLSFFSLSKLELYELFYQNGWIPRYGAIYIGQRLNVRIWDFETKKFIKNTKKTDLPIVAESYQGIVMDQVHESGYFPEDFDQLSYSFGEKGCQLYFSGKVHQLSWETIAIQPVEKLEPKYMVEPNIG